MQTLYRFKGTINTVDDLSFIENRNTGDTYKCKSNSNTYIWNGVEWIDTGKDVDYSEILNLIDTYQEETNMQINEVNNEIINKVNKTTTIASIDLKDNITENELVIALKNNIVNLIYPVRKFLYKCKQYKPTKFIWRNMVTNKR